MYFLLSCETTGLSLQEKKFKIDFKNGSHMHGGHLVFPIGTILPFLIYKSHITSYKSSCQLAFRFKRSLTINFQNGDCSGRL